MNDRDIVLSRHDLQVLLTQAAHDGAKQALADVGLADMEACEDVRELRGLMKTFRLAKKTAFKTFIQQVTNFIFFLLVFGFAAKYGFKIFGG